MATILLQSRNSLGWQKVGKVWYEIYRDGDEVYRAPWYSSLDLDTGQRIGRFYGKLANHPEVTDLPKYPNYAECTIN